MKLNVCSIHAVGAHLGLLYYLYISNLERKRRIAKVIKKASMFCINDMADTDPTKVDDYKEEDIFAYFLASSLPPTGGLEFFEVSGSV